MGILRWLKSFNRSHSKTKALASVLDYFPIPKRIEFQSDQEMLSLIDHYKDSYLEEIRTKEIYYSGDITAQCIRDEMEMYTSLLFRIINNSEDMDFSFDKVDDWNKEESKVLDYKIKTTKLSLYLQRLVVIRRDVQAHMVALDEILNESRFMLSRKRRAISGELNNLVGNYIAVCNQILASEKEKKAFTSKLLTKIEEDTLKNILLDEAIPNEMQSRIEAYHRDLMDMIRVVLPEKENHLKEVSISNIVMAEYLLELYVYKNSQKVEELFTELKELEEDNRDNSILKACIYSLEIKFKAFALYGDKLITREDLYRLYRLKFRIYTEGLKPNDAPIIEGACMIEVESYEKIVFSKINDIMITDLIQIRQPTEVTALEIKKVLQNEEGEFSPWYILSDTKRLLFLLAFSRYDGIERVLSFKDEFEKYYDCIIRISSLPDPRDLFDHFESEVQLRTIFYMVSLIERKELLERAKVEEKLILDDPLFKLYTLYSIGREDTKEYPYFDMWEELKYSDAIDTSQIKRFKDRLQGEWKDKEVGFPKLVHMIDTDFFDDMRFKSLVLNGELEEIQKGFNGASFDKLTIPPSLKTIKPNSFKKARIETIVFEDYLHSHLTKDSFINLLIALTLVPNRIVFKIDKLEITLELSKLCGQQIYWLLKGAVDHSLGVKELDELYDDIHERIERQCAAYDIDFKQFILERKDKTIQ